jgi:serine-type D-Ala-D-Ala carboxypeptidase/endopeptidase
VRDQVEVLRKAVGMVVGVISPQGRHVVARGVMERGGTQRQIAADTVFEIASISKIFPALLLTDMVRRGEVSLDHPVERHLPDGVRVPQRNGRQIRLIDLATHTSGLPPQPPDFPTLEDSAGVAYSVERLYRAVSTYQLTRDIGSEWAYGNLDVALLAHALAHRAAMAFERLVEQRIAVLLGLTSTALQPSTSMAMRLASGHDSDLRPKARLTLCALAPAGGMLSSAEDLLALAGALLELEWSPLKGMLSSMIETRRPIHPPVGKMLRENWRMMLRMIVRPTRGVTPPLRYFTRADAAVGWFIFGRGREELVIHDGAGAHCAASLALDPKSRTAAVVLSNTGQTVQDISRHILRPDFPLARHRREVTLEPDALDRYVGQYQPQRGVLFDVRREGNRLTIGLPVIGGVPLRPESEGDFFVPELGFEFRFPSAGLVSEMLFRPNPALPMIPVKKVTQGHGR